MLHGGPDGVGDVLRALDVMSRHVDAPHEHVLAAEQAEQLERDPGVPALERDLIDPARGEDRRERERLPGDVGELRDRVRESPVFGESGRGKHHARGGLVVEQAREQVREQRRPSHLRVANRLE